MISKGYFKRILTLFLTFVIVFGFNFSGVKKAKAWSTIDQYTVNADGYWRIQSHQIVGQTFRPTYNKLDGVGIYAGIQSSGPSSCTLTVSIYDANTLPPVYVTETTMTIPKEDTYNIADIGPIDTVPDGRYQIQVTASSAYAYWLVSLSNVYDRGYAIVDSTPDAGQDFIFATFGYNDTPPEDPSPAPAPEETGEITGGDAAAETSTDTGSTDSEVAVSNSISSPTNLSAEVVTEGTASSIILTWTASKTADIDGYSILRSVSEKSGYTEIATTDKDTLSYKDDKAVTDQTYYYLVRAYKDGTISKNSNVTSATITDTTPPATPENFHVLYQNEKEVVVAWDKSQDADLSNYILSIADSNEEDATMIETVDTIGKDEVTYTIRLAEYPNLALDTEYTFYLQAKDVSNNYSEKAETSGTFETADESVGIWTWIGLIVAPIILLGLIIFLIIRRRKKRLAKV